MFAGSNGMSAHHDANYRFKTGEFACVIQRYSSNSCSQPKDANILAFDLKRCVQLFCEPQPCLFQAAKTHVVIAFLKQHRYCSEV